MPQTATSRASHHFSGRSAHVRPVIHAEYGGGSGDEGLIWLNTAGWEAHGAAFQVVGDRSREWAMHSPKTGGEGTLEPHTQPDMYGLFGFSVRHAVWLRYEMGCLSIGDVA